MTWPLIDGEAGARAAISFQAFQWEPEVCKHSPSSQEGRAKGVELCLADFGPNFTMQVVLDIEVLVCRRMWEQQLGLLAIYL